MGMSMPAWYDIASLEDINQREDRAGLHESQRYVEELVDAEAAAGVPPGRVVVAGFSQGGAVALMMMRSARALAGVVGMSTYMPLRDEPPVVSGANAKTPLLLCHGTYDNVVAYEFGVATHNALKDLGAAVELKSYPGMAHGVSFCFLFCFCVVCGFVLCACVCVLLLNKPTPLFVLLIQTPQPTQKNKPSGVPRGARGRQGVHQVVRALNAPRVCSMEMRRRRAASPIPGL
jgi:acetyl esterase/lipase